MLMICWKEMCFIDEKRRLGIFFGSELVESDSHSVAMNWQREMK